MNKLTKEQSQYVWEELRKEMSMDECVIKSVLDKCTENQFPKLDLKGLTIYEEYKTIVIENKLTLKNAFSYHAFRQYAEGIAKIKEWLDNADKT